MRDNNRTTSQSEASQIKPTNGKLREYHSVIENTQIRLIRLEDILNQILNAVCSDVEELSENINRPLTTQLTSTRR